jgi:hypothetical protein
MNGIILDGAPASDSDQLGEKRPKELIYHEWHYFGQFPSIKQWSNLQKNDQSN